MMSPTDIARCVLTELGYHQVRALDEVDLYGVNADLIARRVTY